MDRSQVDDPVNRRRAPILDRASYGGQDAAHSRASVHDSLSIIVPVHNDEATLSEQVLHLLDLLPDLTSDFEIVVVDDGSTDHTPDVAWELAREYPQITLVCHAEPLGREAAVKTGLAAAAGETVLVQEDSAYASPAHLRRLWSLRHDRAFVMARTQRRPYLLEPELLDRLTNWSTALRRHAQGLTAGGLQMIRRDAAQGLAGGNASACVAQDLVTQDAPQGP